MNKLSHKAHDISFAVFRVATLIKNKRLREELENTAVDFTVNYEDILNLPSGHVATVFDKLERLISLAGSIKEMKEINASVLKRELNAFQTAVLNQLSEDNRQDVNLSNDFAINTDKTRLDTDGTGRVQNSGLPRYARKDNADSGLPGTEGSTDTGNDSYEASGNSENNNSPLTDRQSAILSKVREISSCRLRDLIEIFSDISERTIRNEIAVLIQHELIKRIGLGGPNSYFESMEVAPPVEHQMQKI